MRTRTCGSALPALLLFTLVVLAVSPIVSHAVPTVTAGSDIVNVGDTFTIPVSITDAAELSSWQFDLSFDPTILNATLVTEGPFLSESGAKTTVFIPGVIDNTTGQITLVADLFADLPPGPSGSGVLANIEFQALGAGVSILKLSNVALDLLDFGFLIQDGQVTVVGAAVPQPGTLMLVGVAFAAWGAVVAGIQRSKEREQ